MGEAAGGAAGGEGGVGGQDGGRARTLTSCLIAPPSHVRSEAPPGGLAAKKGQVRGLLLLRLLLLLLLPQLLLLLLADARGAQVWALAASPDGSCLISGSEEKMVCAWDSKSGTRIGRCSASPKSTMVVNWHPSGNKVLTRISAVSSLSNPLLLILK